MTIIRNYCIGVFDWLIKQVESTREDTIQVIAAPGLATLLDTALYRTHEGQLTATVSSANALLHAFFQLRKCSTELVRLTCDIHLVQQDMDSKSCNTDRLAEQLEALETFARFCLECVDDAVQYLTTEKLAATANLSYQEASPSSVSISSGDVASGVIASTNNIWEEMGSRIDPTFQHLFRQKDCWESTKLYCPDYVWADDAHLHCNKIFKALMRHDTLKIIHNGLKSGNALSKDSSMIKMFEQTIGLIKLDIPIRLHQFRLGLESDTAVSKRLYLIKNEYRAPFRAFLEGHTHVQRAPSLELVDSYIKLHQTKDMSTLKKRRQEINQKKQDLLLNKTLMQIMNLEEKCEEMEIRMAEILFPFCELARLLIDNNAGGKIFNATKTVSSDELRSLHELIRSLSLLLCKKSGPYRSTGIRLLLFDLQRFHRKDSLACSVVINPIWRTDSSLSPAEQLADLLDTIIQLGRSQAFGSGKKGSDLIGTAIESCEDWDRKGFLIAINTWAESCYDQQELSCKMNEQKQSLENLIEELRLTEIHASIANSSQSALSLAQNKISQIEVDRMKRFEVLKDMVEECCIREMNLKIDIQVPKKDLILQLPLTDGSVSGLFDVALTSAGELVTSVHNF
jgi:hypothetical protein